MVRQGPDFTSGKSLNKTVLSWSMLCLRVVDFGLIVAVNYWILQVVCVIAVPIPEGMKVPPPLPSPSLSSFSFPSPLCSVSCPAISLCFRREEVGRGKGKGEFPQPRAKDQMGEGTALLTCTLLLDLWEASSTRGYKVFIPAKAQSLNNITISSQLFQQKLPSDIVPRS